MKGAHRRASSMTLLRHSGILQGQQLDTEWLNSLALDLDMTMPQDPEGTGHPGHPFMLIFLKRLFLPEAS